MFIWSLFISANNKHNKSIFCKDSHTGPCHWVTQAAVDWFRPFTSIGMASENMDITPTIISTNQVFHFNWPTQETNILQCPSTESRAWHHPTASFNRIQGLTPSYSILQQNPGPDTILQRSSTESRTWHHPTASFNRIQGLTPSYSILQQNPGPDTILQRPSTKSRAWHHPSKESRAWHHPTAAFNRIQDLTPFYSILQQNPGPDTILQHPSTESRAWHMSPDKTLRWLYHLQSLQPVTLTSITNLCPNFN